MLKKLMSFALVAFAALALIACVETPPAEEETFTVTFNSQGGSAVAAQTVKDGELAVEPEDPTKAFDQDGSGYQFVGWYTTAEGTGSPYNFETPVTGDLTLFAKWSHHQVVRFNTKTAATIEPVFLGENGGTVAAAPTAPVREGFKFGGWFRGKAGLTWLEPQAVSFPLEVSSSTVLFAYWEPLNSKTVTWSNGETYFSSFTADTTIILNPLVYQFSHEDALIGDLATSLYTTEVDWDKAIADGVADYVGDFSKISSKEYSVESLDYSTILVGATSFPKDVEGDDFTVDGKYDRTQATQITRNQWIFEIREDIFFEDGTQVTAHTYEYTLKQYLDPKQNNFRKTSYYKNATNTQGFPILNAAEYNLGYDDKGTSSTDDDVEVTVTWDQVGFEVIDDFTFKVTTWQPVSQAAAVGFGNIRLVHPTAYAASLNQAGTNSTYGTPANPYISYGAYIIKNWAENQRIVLNKNYNYVKKDVINYKSVVYEIVADIPARMALFEQGGLSGVGLISPYYEAYAENPNVYKSWDGYPQYIILNYAPSKLTENPYQKPAIMQDARFRQALLYGFNRTAFANTVYAPNTATILPVPLDTKAYIQDALYYSQSPAHAAVLEAHGITAGTEGYILERAQQLFDAALADFKAANPEHTGPITLKFISDNAPLSMDLANWIKEAYETAFNTPGQKDKLVIEIVSQIAAATNALRAAYDFDLYLASVGFGASYGIHWQMAGIPFLGGLLASQFGLQGPFDETGADYSDILLEDVEIDLTATYEYLLELGEDYIYQLDDEGEDALPGYIYLWESMQAEEDKEAGIFRGNLLDLAFVVYSESVPYDATAQEPFPGATQDVWAITAAFENVFLELVPMVPTVTRSSAVIYADNVKILWPDYSSAFGWGSNRYRYLSTDADFEFGIYNAYQVAFEAAQAE